MATSGSINGSCTGGSGGKYNFTAEWKRNSYSIADCSSNITIDLYVQRNDGYSSSAYNLDSKPGVTLKVGGASKTPTTYLLDTRKGAKCRIATWTGNVDHNTDGSLTLPISATFTHSGSTSLSGGSLSGNASITTIPQASSIDSLTCATKYFDGTMTYKYTPKNASFYNRCNISLSLNGEFIAVKSILLGQKSASQQTETVTLTADELGTIYDRLPKTDKGTLRFTFRTYSDSGYMNQIGDFDYKELNLHIPENSSTKPSVTMTLAPENSVSSAWAAQFSAVYIQGRSKVDANFEGSGNFNADIESYKVKVDGKDYSSPYTSDFLDKSGEITVIGTATDTRGFSNEDTQKIYVWPYNKPKLLPASGEKEIICKRCDENGNYTDSGTYLRVKVKRSCSDVKKADGTAVNKCFIDFRCKAENEVWDDRMWTTILPAQNEGNVDEIDTWDLLTLGISNVAATTSYIAEIKVTDYVGETTYTTISIPTDRVYDHEAGNRRSYAFGKYVEDDNTFDIAEDIDFKVRTKGGPATIIKDTGWIDMGLSENVTEGTYGGRNGVGCYYRVINGNHVYVAFSCGCEYSGAEIVVNQNAIPEEYRPSREAFALVTTQNRNISRTYVDKNGNVRIEWIQLITSTADTTSITVGWIDGYIDYWIN